MSIIQELTWRGMIHDVTPGAEEKLDKEKITVYAGFDPTATSLQLGNFVPIMLLVHFQRAGHRPLALVGGATGMIGDPSGKSEERTLLSVEQVHHNMDCIRKQLTKFLDFSSSGNGAELVNNYDWFKDFKFLDFLREVGKHLTVNYMIAKESVKQRMEAGISFTEFSYQLLQAYDFCWLYRNKQCTFQVGGSDQWGNITAGTELIRRMEGGEAHALTCPLMTKSDGTKFGKSEDGEKIWLDPEKTSPYRFYQFWLNQADEDARRFIRIFTLLSRDEIDSLTAEHEKAPHLRPLQKALARDVTIRVHSEADYQKAIETSEILFGEGTTEKLRTLPERDFLTAFEGVPQSVVARSEFERGINVIDLLGEKTRIFTSKGEARRMVSGGGVSINKSKVADHSIIVSADSLLNGKYVLVQKGKKNYHIIKAE
jgi:tyrosyl-tRNA synthetase